MAQVQQRTRVVLADRAYPLDAGQSQEQRCRERGLVERREDHGSVDARDLLLFLQLLVVATDIYTNKNDRYVDPTFSRATSSNSMSCL